MKMYLKLHRFFILKLLCALICCLKLCNLMSTIKVGTLNLNGARDIKKRALLFELITQKNIDVTFIQETHSDRLNEIDWQKEWERDSVPLTFELHKRRSGHSFCKEVFANFM